MSTAKVIAQLTGKIDADLLSVVGLRGKQAEKLVKSGINDYLTYYSLSHNESHDPISTLPEHLHST